MDLNDTTLNLLLRKIGRRRDEIHGYLFSDATPITGITCRETRAYETYEEAVAADGYRSIEVGGRWGGNASAWFRVPVDIPAEWEGRSVSAFFRLGGDGCVHLDGLPYHGIDRFHQEVPLLESARGGEHFDLVIDAISGFPWEPGESGGSVLEKAEIATRNREVWDYWFDLTLLYELAVQLPADSTRRSRIIHLLNKSVDAFDYTNTDAASLARSALCARDVLAPLMDCRANGSAMEFSCIGHSHIDTAWKWPYRETRRKCARTFSTVQTLMDRYPEYLFSQGQAQLYEFVRESYPHIYSQILRRVKEGRWEVTGSTWVEADCNLTSGESLVRQILYGKAFFSEQFGIETDVLWLPDVFGYSAALPQILRRAGVRYFATNKIRWNEFNQPPHGTFWWRGIDGSRVLAHFPPSVNYNGFPAPEWFARYENAWQDKDRSNQIIFTYGWGDGGGGPENRHLEYLIRVRDLEGAPRCTHRTISEFFHEIDGAAEYPEWAGELYLEFHRGTYTTNGRIKRQNRKAELLYRDAELLSIIAEPLGLPCPREELREQWKKLLTNQFHDVLPGTSIRQVYKDTDRMYEEIFAVGERVRHDALRVICAHIGAGDGSIVVFNTLPWERADVASIDVPEGGPWAVVGSDGIRTPSRVSGRKLLFAAMCPAMGYSVYRLTQGTTQPENDLRVTETSLENRFYRITVDRGGAISSLIHKQTGRQVLPEGQRGNVLRLFEDKPTEYPAWEIEFHYEGKGGDITEVDRIEVVETGPVRAAVEITRSFGKSRLVQRIVLYSDLPRIDFETWIDWNENEKLLRAYFPVDVNAAAARFEIQFGSVERPTNRNTSWEAAKFEVPGQRWADLSDSGFGLSLMTDCKYGYSAHGNTLGLSLLRSPKKPDAESDMGEHEFTYSIMPHADDHVEAGTVRRAYELNVPMVTATSPPSPQPSPSGGEGEGKPLPDPLLTGEGAHSFFGVDVRNVVLDTVKKAEKEEAVILRFYECHNRRGKVRVQVGLPFAKVYECDLMEKNIGEVSSKAGSFEFDIKPFEIRTFKLF